MVGKSSVEEVKKEDNCKIEYFPIKEIDSWKIDIADFALEELDEIPKDSPVLSKKYGALHINYLNPCLTKRLKYSYMYFFIGFNQTLKGPNRIFNV